MLHRFLADLVLILHACIIAFVIGGLVAVLIGAWRRWDWVRNFWFRAAHLAAIAFVVLQQYAGMICPLTTWESELRLRGGQQPYSDDGFIAYWLHRMIFFEAPTHVFTIAYTTFGLLVVLAMIFSPPRLRMKAPLPESHPAEKTADRRPPPSPSPRSCHNAKDVH